MVPTPAVVAVGLLLALALAGSDRFTLATMLGESRHGGPEPITTLPGPPATPTGFAVGNPTDITLDLIWNASAGATAYEVWSDHGSGGTIDVLVGTTASTAFTHSDLVVATTYRYQVLARNGAMVSPRTAIEAGTTPCFSFTNTAGGDFTNNDWLNDCADATGTTVRVRLLDAGNSVMFEATGTKIGVWSRDFMTSTAPPPNQQFNSANHDRLITLSNGDELMVTGQSATDLGCGGSFGNGYGIVVYPAPANYYFNPKLIVMPDQQFVAPYTGTRLFSGWTPAHEITWAGGASFNTCNTITGAEYLGTFQFFVKP